MPAAMDLIEQIGAVLGLAAFLGLAVLALLYFQQARDVRRLREWAGKAPERAAAAAAEADATGEHAPVTPPPAGILSRIGARVRAAGPAVGRPIAAAWQALDRRSPVDLRIILVVLAIAAAVAVVFVVHPFGLLEDDKGGGKSSAPGKEAPPPGQIEVAIVNGTTASEEPIPDLAGQVDPIVRQADYDIGRLGDATEPYDSSVIMYVAGHKVEASALAGDLEPELGEIPIEPINEEIRELAAGAGVALVVGPDAAQ
jgi:hypothetical protein